MTAIAPDSATAMLAIQQLLIRFARAADEGTIEELLACFTDGAEWALGPMTWKGGAAIAAGLSQMRAGGISGPGTGTRHLISNVMIDMHANDRATVDSCFLFMVSGAEGPALRALGSYRDVVVLEAGDWRFARRSTGP